MTDTDTIRALRVSHLRSYLEAHGWELRYGRCDATYWYRSGLRGGTIEVVLPIHDEFGGHVLRMSQAIRAISDAEDLPEHEVLRKVRIEGARHDLYEALRTEAGPLLDAFNRAALAIGRLLARIGRRT